MKKEDALKILEDKLSEYRKLSYLQLVEKIGEQETFQAKTEKGEDYQIEIDFFFDDEKEKTMRVTGMISCSGWTDFFPITSDFIVNQNGKFIGE
jgi:hypothetical protein